MLKRGPELSLELDPFFDGRRPRSMYASQICWEQCRAAVYTPSLPFSTSLLGIWFTTLCDCIGGCCTVWGVKRIEETLMTGEAP